MTINFRSLANECVRKITPYIPGKPIEELERELGISDSIKLASNENPLGPSAQAMIAAQEALSSSHLYPDGSCYEIKQLLAQQHGVQSEQITVGNGSENILEIIIKSYLSPNDTAIFSQYTFLTIPILLQSYGIHAKIIPMKGFEYDGEGVLEAIDEKTRVIFLVNPNNPTGTYIRDQDLHTILDRVPPHILMVIDEAYAEYATVRDYATALKYLNRYSNLLIIRTFSKIYGLAALRLGYCISSPDIADMLNRARLPFNVNAIAIKAGCAALKDQQHVLNSIMLNQQGLLNMQEKFKQLNLQYISSIANFISVDVNFGTKIYQKLLHEGIIVRPLDAYLMPKHIRVTIGTADQNARFFAALEKVISS